MNSNSDKPPGDSSGQALPPPNPSDDRRKQASELDKRDVVFVDTGISQERLEALKKFLKNASRDEIAMVRRMYGDNLAVLKIIGAQVVEETVEEPKTEAT